MSACPETSLFREAEISYALICMATDYDSWHPGTEAVDVQMVMAHMAHNGANARRAVEAVLEALSLGVGVGKGEETVGEGEGKGAGTETKQKSEIERILSPGQRKWQASVGIVTSLAPGGPHTEAEKKLDWLFG